MSASALLELNDFDDDDVTIEEFGTAGERVLVIDNFYRDPDRIRALALEQREWYPQRIFPGLRADVPVDTGPLFAALVDWIDIDGIRPDSECDGKIVFSMSTARDADVIRYNAELPHFDQHSDLAGLVYLNPPEQCRGGTAFYRHRATGVARWPWNKDRRLELCAQVGISVDGKTEQEIGDTLWRSYFDPPGERPKRYLRGSNDIWDMTKLVDMKYNRAIFYETDLFHAMYVRDDDFGDDLPTRRLTQTLFLSVDRKA